MGRHLTTEQILGILHWHGYDTAAASADLDAYCAHPAKQPEWTTDEQRTFVSLFKYVVCGCGCEDDGRST